MHDFDEVIDNVNLGSCALFVDTLDIVYNIDVKGYKQRGLQPPTNEIIIRGAQEAFTEVLRTNTSLLRRFVNNENLIIENVNVGKLSKTPCSICYLNNVYLSCHEYVRRKILSYIQNVLPHSAKADQIHPQYLSLS